MTAPRVVIEPPAALVAAAMEWAEGSACMNETAKVLAAKVRCLEAEVDELRFNLGYDDEDDHDEVVL